MAGESKARTVMVALAVCLVCSIGVSAAAVFLKPLQTANKLADKRKNILQVVNLYEPGMDVNGQFDSLVNTRLINLESGEFVQGNDLNPATYDMYVAAKDPAMSSAIPKSDDIARIGRKPEIATVYLVEGDAGEVKAIILPVQGYGLWGQLYGFLALEGDARTVVGLSFYDHKETPGLGGEVDNLKWKGQWPGKLAYDAEGDVALRLIKGTVEPGAANAEYKVDGLAGATLTSNGVSNLIQFWLSEAGYKPFLDNVRS